MPIHPNLLESIRQRPGMYMGESTLTALYHTISGYNSALGAHGIKDDPSLRLPADFHDWVAYRLHYKESTSGWKNMILGAVGNELDGFVKFFELLDEHAARKPHVVAKLDPDERRSAAVVTPIWDETVRHPKAISLVTYTDDPGFFVIGDESACFHSAGGFLPSLDWLELFTKIHRSELTVLDAETFARWSSGADQP